MRSISRSRSRRQEGSWTEKMVSGAEEDPGLKPPSAGVLFRGLKPPAPSGKAFVLGLRTLVNPEDGTTAAVRVQPRAVRYWWISSGVRAEFVGVSSRVAPRWRWTCLTESWMGGRDAVRAAIWGMMTSMSAPSAWPPCWRMRLETRALATGAALKSAPRSKRWEASVWRPWRREERRML